VYNKLIFYIQHQYIQHHTFVTYKPTTYNQERIVKDSFILIYF
jgi:hypothetical protein